MRWLIKFMSVAQALLLLPLVVSKHGDAALTPDSSEDAAWAQSVSIGTPQALQKFISQYPHSDKVDSAFDLMIEFQVESAKTLSLSGGLGSQLAQSDSATDLDLPAAEDLIGTDPY